VAVDLLPHLRRARDHIDRHYQMALDLDQLAAVAGVSKFHFVRSFEAAYGETPIRYLTRRRIERAQDLLRVANLTVTEVCMLVGFASLGSFSSRFAQLVGESPTVYRDRWAAQGAARTCPDAICSCVEYLIWAVPRNPDRARRTAQSERSAGQPARVAFSA
jgi:AraC-like DNA-binding protein